MQHRTTIKSFLAFLLLGSFVFLSGCGRFDSGDELLGKWINTKYPEYNLVIERNGGSFMIRRTQHNLYYGGIETVNIPATLKDGVLMTTQLFPLTLDRTSGKLTDGKSEYRHEK